MPAQQTSPTDWSSASSTDLPITISRLACTAVCTGRQENNAIALSAASSEKQPSPPGRRRAATVDVHATPESLLRVQGKRRSWPLGHSRWGCASTSRSTT